ncbi:MAG: aldolase/citrate lyase family protein [Candidatus Bipolaricaulota bacterium]|nr:aldolase/citrate lyase family protein [Candidatus Bipolaricaulota bacterium]MDW8126409.1 aldolase/citrate lyase family protein [Candidatus Bipolaricaulota bacterium]
MNLREKLQKREPVFGTMLRDALTLNVVDALLWAGLDFFVLDMEHTALDLATVGQLLQYAQARGLPALVRVPTLDKAFISRALDCGASGIWLPHLDTVGEAKELVFLGRYPPRGGRGATISWPKRQRAQTLPKLAEFFAAEDAQVSLVGQIESQRAVENIEEILTSGLLDAVVIGPLDLSTDLGVPGEFRHPTVEEAIAKVLAAGRKHKVSVGLHTANLEDLRRWRSAGMNFLVYSYDLVLMAEAAKAARSNLFG